ncbi:MAG: hypothetical protein WAU69_03025 [Solirubrobacteraceae bacterium]
MNSDILPEASFRFRAHLLAALDRCTPLYRFFYLSEDQMILVCPVCDAALTVAFAGTAARADLSCHRGCGEPEITAALRGRP